LKHAEFAVRSMARTPEGVLEATACVVDGGWGTYRQYHAIFTFYATHRRCSTFIARDADGRVAGTGVAIRYGRTGWIGHVFVRPDLRNIGLGSKLTSAALAHLQRAGCESIVLVATDLGRRIYERMGFTTESHYHELRGRPLPKTVELHPFRPLLPSDHRSLLELDARVAGDDRASIVSSFESYAWGVTRQHLLAGVVIPLPWGGAAAYMLPDATRAETAAMVRLIRTVGSIGDEVIVYPTDENQVALDLLIDQGFTELRTAPRMVLGKPTEWLAAAVWNPFSLGLG
jgi:GNAT superfamily N-acetyltransferase